MARAPSIPPVVDAAWLDTHRHEVVVCDVRWYLDGCEGREAYRRGHLPGAVFVDLDRDLAAAPSVAGGRHPLPDPEEFASAMRRVGVSDGDTVVAYDDRGGATAARLVWMLRVLGEDAAVLDGGVDAWDGPLEIGEVEPVPGRFTPRRWPHSRLASTEDVDRLRIESSAAVIDAREAARYRGDEEPVDPRAGHIPGVRNLPYGGNLTAEGRFRRPEELRRRYAAAGAEDTDVVVVHCGSGVTACHALLALEHAGMAPARLYAGSWSAWSADPQRPVATGATPEGDRDGDAAARSS